LSNKRPQQQLMSSRIESGWPGAICRLVTLDVPSVSYIVPATYYINITRGIILRGAQLAHLWTDALALFAMGTALLLVAARRFQHKIIAP
jgi:ABC-type multidrug transport system permease subunit